MMAEDLYRDYHIKRNIFSLGRFSSFVAVQKSLAREVTLNQVSLYYSDLPDKLRSCEEEIRKWARLDHPNLVEFIDGWAEETRLVFITTYPQGKTLESLATSRRSLEVAEALRIGREIAQVMEYLHGQGLFHGHLQLGFFTLVEEGWIKLTQTGLPLIVNHLFDDAVVAFGPSDTGFLYQRSDVAAWGNIMGALLTGNVYFEKEREEEFLPEQLSPEAESFISEVNPKVPEDLEQIVTRALSTMINPKKGYVSFTEILEDLSAMTVRTE